MVGRMLCSVESAAGTVIGRIGIDALLRKVQRSKVPILMYHSIQSDLGDGSSCLTMAGMTISESRFRDHMRYVASHYNTITLSEYMSRRCNGELPKNACVLTFDDGFEDFFETARPILAERGLTAVIFVIGSTLEDHGRGSWLHDLYSLIDASPTAACSKAMARVLPDCPSEGFENRADLRRWARQRFEDLEPTERAEGVATLEADLVVDSSRRQSFLTKRQLRQLVAEGFEIGGHSMHHHPLATLDDEMLETEIVDSKKAIEEVAGNETVSFCYPFGGRNAWDDRTVGELRKHGFSCAVTTVEGLNGTDADAFALRRIRITGDIPRSVLVFRILGLRSPLWSLHGLLKRTKGMG